MTTNQVADPRTAVVTGGTSGIGRALAEALAVAGLTVGIVARDPRRGEEARAAIAAASGNPRVKQFSGDLSDLSSVHRLAEALAEAHPSISLLVHCAAIYTPRRRETVDGLETMFATNVVGPFLLTRLLHEPLVAGRARILAVTAPSTVKLDFEDLQAQRRFRSLTAFGATKTADLLFTFELARRLQGTGVTVNAIHPGLVRTNLMRGAPAPVRWAQWLFSRGPADAVESIVPVAIAPDYDGVSGRFYRAGREIEAPPYTRDPEIAGRFWEATASLARLSQEASS